jgi:hypothetical protein
MMPPVSAPMFQPPRTNHKSIHPAATPSSDIFSHPGCPRIINSMAFQGYLY